MTFPQRLPALALAIILLMAITSCTEEAADDQDVPGVAPESTPASLAGRDTVDLDIIEGPGGSVVIFVPIFIQGEGPFDFVLDTGASRSVIDESVAAQFDFPEIEEVGDVTGIGGTAVVNLVEVEQWTMGDAIDLPASQVTSFPVFEDHEAAAIEERMGREVQGLLGSDILIHFGIVTIDFETSQLTVGN